MSLEARQVSVRLGKTLAVDGVSVRVPVGSITVVAGPNGAGKSTMLKVLAGLLPVASGAVELNGKPLSHYTRRDLAREIAYLPQERAVHWPVNAAVAVGLGRLPHRSAAAGENEADRAAVASAMRTMDVAQFASRPVSELSGGERARVLIARALAQGSNILVADEPTAGLDPSHALQLFAHFKELSARGHTIVTAIHDLSLAARFAGSIVLMKSGRLAAQGLPRDVMTPATLATVYAIRATLQEVDGIPVVLARETMT